ncbi:MAG: DHH family phosphoesterase [Lachnospiraceae bacterium]|nr:DHH family phosphoesterase [Lachnospiraceae bacterium]
MAKWMVAAKRADFDQIAKKYGISPVMARILRNRDLESDKEIRKFLYGTVQDLYDPLLMKDMEKAAGIIESKIKQRKSIRVIGDYDVDGICASYLLLTGLRALGAKVDVVIPHRMKDGYGLNDNLIKDALEAGIDTVITCDNGIAAAPQIHMAKENGMTVVVTDHHEVPYEETDGKRVYLIPPADAVVDPKQEDCGYPFKQICGAVVAGKLVSVLLRSAGDLEQKAKLQEELLVFGALATVCDVMELRDENRIIVKEGLRLMAGTSNLGLKALLMVNGIEDTAAASGTLTPYHAGFVIGPCMNASGRLDTAERALALFDCREWSKAVNIAGDLKSLNDNRKMMTEQGVLEAVRQVESGGMETDKVLVIYLPDCHESLAWIIYSLLYT